TALGDGGMAVLGANILNMALLPATVLAAANRFSSSWTRSPRSLAALAVAAGVAVPLAALLIVAETALFRSTAELAGWNSFAAIMLSTHAWIGIFEAGLTTVLVAA